METSKAQAALLAEGWFVVHVLGILLVVAWGNIYLRAFW